MDYVASGNLWKAFRKEIQSDLLKLQEACLADAPGPSGFLRDFEESYFYPINNWKSLEEKEESPSVKVPNMVYPEVEYPPKLVAPTPPEILAEILLALENPDAEIPAPVYHEDVLVTEADVKVVQNVAAATAQEVVLEEVIAKVVQAVSIEFEKNKKEKKIRKRKLIINDSDEEEAVQEAVNQQEEILQRPTTQAVEGQNAVVNKKEALESARRREISRVSTTAVAHRRKIKETPAQKNPGTSQSDKPSESGSLNPDKKPTSSKPPTGPKRKVSSSAASDDEDKSPPCTRQGLRKRQKSATPSKKGKGASPSKTASPTDKASSEDSPLKTTSNILVVESHNSSPDNIQTKVFQDDAGTATSGFKDPGLTIDVPKLYDTSRDKAPALSPVVEDAQPINTMLPDEPVEESHSTDESPATHQDKSLEGEDHALSGSDNVNLHPHHSDDTVSESDAMEETSKLEKQNFQEASTLDTKADPGTTSMPAPTPSELEQLKHADPLSFLKIIMNVDTSSSPSPDAIPVATVGSGNQEDTSSLLRQIKERFFDVNLVDLLIRDPLKSHGLNQLLKKVDLLQVSTTVSDVLVLLGSLVEQLQADILRKRSIERELSEAMASRDSSWNSAVDATQRVSTTAVAHRRKIKETPAQKNPGTSQSDKPSESGSLNPDKKPTSSKPPTGPKRKVSSSAASDDEDKSPPCTRQGLRKRQKSATPSKKGKGASPSKTASPTDKASSEDSPLKTTSNILVVESHNSSPDNIQTKVFQDDAGTATSGFKDPGLTIDVPKLYDTSRDKAPALSPVVEDAQPINTMLPDEPVEESHSTDESPATHQDKSLEGEDHALSGSDNVNLHPHHSDDTVSESDAMEETSKLEKQNFQEASTLDTKADPGTTSMPAPTPSELEQLKHADPLRTNPVSISTTAPSSSNASEMQFASTNAGSQLFTPGSSAFEWRTNNPYGMPNPYMTGTRGAGPTYNTNTTTFLPNVGSVGRSAQTTGFSAQIPNFTTSNQAAFRQEMDASNHDMLGTLAQ
ncbi:flocculation protein FLO11-like [Vicia villosa]|uniref:flocculation protein FLO11-like n=1 Tax=Vicia villosa TaxID=3911 RepID=UPI00273C2EEC|nr:flocculation protein FLO11-like [Vicia villosa]